MSVLYEELTPGEFRERIEQCPVGYLALGTLEWHSPHLPLGVDRIASYELFKLAAERFGGIVFPPLFLGVDRSCVVDGKEYFGMDMYIPELRCPPYPLQQFPGSCYWVPEETFRVILDATFKQAARAGFKILMGKGHGPSQDIFRSMADETKEKYSLTLLTPEDGEPLCRLTGDHAAKCETSAIMYFRPELVHMENLSGDPDDFPKGVSGDDPRYHASPEYTASQLPGVLSHMENLIKEALQ